MPHTHTRNVVVAVFIIIMMLSAQQQQAQASTQVGNKQMASPVSATCTSPSTTFSPIQFIYTHLHDAIRAELDFLGQQVLALEPALDGNANTALEHSLTLLKTRYKFLTNIYKYHSSVEDEVRTTPTTKAPTFTRNMRWWWLDGVLGGKFNTMHAVHCAGCLPCVGQQSTQRDVVLSCGA